MSKVKKQRSFLKWAGGKYGLMEPIQARLPKGKRLVEPFVGAATVFLNTDYDEYLLNDINQDLIDIYLSLQRDPQSYIELSESLFVSENNNNLWI